MNQRWTDFNNSFTVHYIAFVNFSVGFITYLLNVQIKMFLLTKNAKNQSQFPEMSSSVRLNRKVIFRQWEADLYTKTHELIVFNVSSATV